MRKRFRDEIEPAYPSNDPAYPNVNPDSEEGKIIQKMRELDAMRIADMQRLKEKGILPETEIQRLKRQLEQALIKSRK